MRSKVRAAAFFVGFLTFLLCASVYLRLFRYVSSSSASTAATADYSAALRLHPHLHLTIDDDRAPSASSSLHVHPSAAVLLPDWQALLLLPRTPPSLPLPLLCLFSDNSTSSATPVGILPLLPPPLLPLPPPPSVRRRLPFLTPRLLPSSYPKPEPLDHPPELMRWTSIAYESLSTPDDVIVFAKGVNSRQGVNRSPSDLLCLFSDGSTTAVTTSAQEVFRCPHPSPPPLPERTVQVSLKILSENKVIPSVASYRRRPLARADSSPPPQKSLLCACTMVYNVAKFLPEWVTYHASIGVDRFILYDNMSDDDLKGVVGKLKRENHNNITTYRWPWPKTQEAGFSHCLTLHRDTCHWIAFIDVDEFLFSPAWAKSPRPSKSMLGSTLTRLGPSIGQATFGCDEFGPSDLKAHPMDGVTQGYTCRRSGEQRHKSIVRPGAVDLSLVNVVHHFKVREGVYKVRRLGRHEGVVKHYKYQAWPEFKAKFRRRVSAYVVDWTQMVNKGSKDRAPGLGFAPVEPVGWAQMFCEVNDTGLRDVTRRWFRVGSGRLAWEL